MGEDTYRGYNEIIEPKIHPKYDGEPSSGYDIAYCYLGNYY